MEERYHGDTCKREDPAWSRFLNGWGARVDDHECLPRLDRTCASGGTGGPPLASQSAVDRLNHLRFQPVGCYSNRACWTAVNECMHKGCTCINGERATHGTELPKLVEWCPADTLHMNPHRQLAVKMNSEIADCWLGTNSTVAEMNVIDADLWKQLSTALSYELCFLRIIFRRFEDIHRSISSMQEATLLIIPTTAAALS